MSRQILALPYLLIYGTRCTTLITSAQGSTSIMAWPLLIFSGLTEIAFTTALSRAHEASGTTALVWYAVFGVALIIGMGAFTVASKDIPMGTAYAVFAGMGAAGTALVQILIFQEPATLTRSLFLTMLIVSVVGLNLVSR